MLAEHLLRGEELAHAELGEDADVGVRIHVACVEDAAREDGARHDVEPVRDRLDDPQFQLALVEAGVAAHHARGHGAGDAGDGLADARLVVVQEAVDRKAGGGLGGGARSLLGGRLHGVDHDVLAPEALDGFERLVARAFADGEHGDDRTDAEDHAEHREERARLVAPHVRGAELDEGPVEGKGLHGISSGRRGACRP